MRQLLLELGAAKPQTLDSFVVGCNQELAALLRLIEAGASRSLDQRFITIWGEPGAGKSHLLNALASSSKARLLPASATLSEFSWSPDVGLYLLDDCDLLSADLQIAAFALYNQVREAGGSLIAVTSKPPAQLTLREDLRTRLGWGLIYQLHGLSDEEKIAALSLSAAKRGLSLSAGVLPYLLTHYRRDMQSLSGMLDALDHYSLETQRPITMPLLRELMQRDDTAKLP
ncbi:MAG: DnaA regulatory inactivator Hda [Burkholderiaceae bacterium]|jgi:DnaA family protein